MYRASDSQKVPALAIEYKAPHKLSVDEVVTGLKSEIWPERDVINRDCRGFAFIARALATAVITQLFSYMIGKGIQYGYVCTGQAFVFLHIPGDPATIYFSICVPSLDVMEDDEARSIARPPRRCSPSRSRLSARDRCPSHGTMKPIGLVPGMSSTTIF